MGVIFEKLLDIAKQQSLPNDLKTKKKVNLKIAKKETSPEDLSDLKDDVVDMLYDEGLIEIDDSSEP